MKRRFLFLCVMSLFVTFLAFSSPKDPLTVSLSFEESSHSKAFSVYVQEGGMATIDISALREVYGVMVEVLDTETSTMCVKFFKIDKKGENALVERKVISRKDVIVATENTNAEFVFRAKIEKILQQNDARDPDVNKPTCTICCVSCERVPGCPTTVCGVKAICDGECCTCQSWNPCVIIPPKQ